MSLFTDLLIFRSIFRSEYEKKLVVIFFDETEFECLGPVNKFDDTAQNETKLQRRFLQLVKSDDPWKRFMKLLDPRLTTTKNVRTFKNSQTGCALPSYSFDDWISLDHVGRMVEWLERRVHDQHGLGLKLTLRRFTLFSPAWWS